MAKLLTDWMTIATAGATVDGREILPEWLEQMAANYNRAEYTAVLWDSHDHFCSFGAIDALQLITDDKNRLALQAQIEPLADLVWAANHNVLFFSIEVDDNFQDSGQAYLGGVALTSEPASVATSQLKFSKQQNARVISNAQPVAGGAFSLNPNPKKEFTMDQAQFEQLMAALADISAKQDTIIAATAKVEEAVEVIEEEVAAVADEVVGAVDETASKKHSKKVRAGGGFASLKKEFTALQTKLGQTPAPQPNRTNAGSIDFSDIRV